MLQHRRHLAEVVSHALQFCQRIHTQVRPTRAAISEAYDEAAMIFVCQPHAACPHLLIEHS